MDDKKMKDKKQPFKIRSNKMKRIISLKTMLASFALALMMTTTLFAEQKQVSVRVDGLSCPFCAYGLEKKLKSIDGVEKLVIKVNDGLAILTYKDGAKIDKDVIAKKVKEAGFTPGEITIGTAQEQNTTKDKKITLNVQGMTCDNCVSRVKKALEEVDCVQNVGVDLEKGEATITCTDKKYDTSKFVEIVNGLGFKATLEKK